jgi:flavin reductase (DIM6/NTAB) family NADH-FMN oxidoreductase RutF
MKKLFQTIDADRLELAPFHLIGKEWMLITAGTLESWNTMTASWGGLGVLWNRHVAWCVIRPTRHTYTFVEQSDLFTLSFFDARHRKALEFCGSHSGREVDKAAETGLEPVEPEPGVVTFRQTRLALVCRKIYFDDLDPSRFLDPAIESLYPQHDYHRLYIGEVRSVLQADDAL